MSCLPNSGLIPRNAAIMRPACGMQHMLPTRFLSSPFFSFGIFSECRGQPIKENIVAGSSKRFLYQIKVHSHGDGRRPSVHHGIRFGDCDTSTERFLGTLPSFCSRYRNAQSRTSSSWGVSCRLMSSGQCHCTDSQPRSRISQGHV